MFSPMHIIAALSRARGAAGRRHDDQQESRTHLLMVPARCELPGRFGDDPIATAPRWWLSVALSR
jgi:hypothetical protein